MPKRNESVVRTLDGMDGKRHHLIIFRDNKLTGEADEGFNVTCTCGAAYASISQCSSGFGDRLDELYHHLYGAKNAMEADSMFDWVFEEVAG